MAFDPTQPGGRQPDLLGPEEDADIPPPPRGLAADPIDEDDEERLQRLSRRGRALPALLVVGAIGVFAAIVWWAYRSADVAETPGEIPVVEAQPGDEKVRPESEGGMDVPNQDKLIYQQLGQSGSGAGEGQPEVERLLPPPEEPMEPPAPPAVAEPPAATANLTPPPPPQDTPDEVVPNTPQPDAAGVLDAEPAPAPGDAAGEETQTAADAPPPAAPAPEAAPAEPEPAPVAEAPAEPTPPAPAAEEPAAQVAAADAFRVQLAAVKSEAHAKEEWARLQKVYAELLGPLEPTIQRAELDQGTFFRIQGGPLPSREAADSLCAQLKQKDQACLVVKP